LGKIEGKIGGRHYRILTSNELDLSFPVPNDCAKFHEIRFKIVTTGTMTDRQTPAILLSVACNAIATGQTTTVRIYRIRFANTAPVLSVSLTQSAGMPCRTI